MGFFQKLIQRIKGEVEEQEPTVNIENVNIKIELPSIEPKDIIEVKSKNTYTFDPVPDINPVPQLPELKSIDSLNELYLQDISESKSWSSVKSREPLPENTLVEIFNSSPTDIQNRFQEFLYRDFKNRFRIASIADKDFWLRTFIKFYSLGINPQYLIPERLGNGCFNVWYDEPDILRMFVAKVKLSGRNSYICFTEDNKYDKEEDKTIDYYLDLTSYWIQHILKVREERIRTYNLY